MQIHYLSEQALQAAHLTPSATPAKLRAGWQWHRLVPSFCTTGGAGTYSRALVSAAGDVAYVSDRAEGQKAQDIVATLEIDHTMVRLNVPFTDKDEAKRLGAKWIGSHKTWACAPDQANAFGRWISGLPETFDILTLEDTADQPHRDRFTQ